MYDPIWIGILLSVVGLFLVMETAAFILEFFFHIKRFPTLSTLLVGRFGVKPLVIATIIIGALLAWHWQLVADNMSMITRALGGYFVQR